MFTILTSNEPTIRVSDLRVALEVGLHDARGAGADVTISDDAGLIVRIHPEPLPFLSK